MTLPIVALGTVDAIEVIDKRTEFRNGEDQSFLFWTGSKGIVFANMPQQQPFSMMEETMIETRQILTKISMNQLPLSPEDHDGDADGDQEKESNQDLDKLEVGMFESKHESPKHV